MGGACIRVGEMRNAYKILVGDLQERILVRRPGHK